MDIKYTSTSGPPVGAPAVLQQWPQSFPWATQDLPVNDPAIEQSVPGTVGAQIPQF